MAAKLPVSQPAGNYYDKYNTGNPIAQLLMRGFLRSFGELTTLAGTAGRAIEVGCGEGELSIRLARSGWRVEGCDIAVEAVEEARRRVAAAGLDIPVRVLDIRGAIEVYQRAELVVCCEVLEHLDDTHGALDALAHLSSRYLLVSVPREPVWRMMNMARGRYLAALGNTPGHIQHWSREAFLRMLSARFEIVAARSPLPWTLALCRVASS
jgi:2-polyprenyl-3-methyl-5-hydroxy-6-metoxy-1,4-benzoquinol methylase